MRLVRPQTSIMSLPKIRSKFNTVNKLISNHRIKNGYFVKKGDRKFVIVMYHGIDIVQSTKYNQRFFSKADFEKQIALFTKHFNVLSHSDFVADKFSDTKLNMLITFDDGYLNNLKYAVPVLEQYNAHAYFFITGVGPLTPNILWADAIDIVSKHATGGHKLTLKDVDFELREHEFINRDTGVNVKSFIKDSATPGYSEKRSVVNQLLSIYDFTKDNGAKDYWQLMNNEEIARASQSRQITIGSHGLYHNNLGSLSLTDAVAEVENSQNYLENIIQKPVTTIAFPDGSYTPELNNELYGRGFAKQFLVNYNFSDAGNKDYVYDRFGLYPFMGNPNQLLYQIIN